MTLISLPDFLSLISNPRHLFAVDGCPAVLYPSALKREDSSVFLLITWTDAKAYECAAAFEEGVNHQIKRDGSAVCLIDTSGTIIRLTIDDKAA